MQHGTPSYVLSSFRKSLQAALEAQRSFWKFVGIGFLLRARLYALIIVGAVIVGIMSAQAARTGHDGLYSSVLRFS